MAAMERPPYANSWCEVNERGRCEGGKRPRFAHLFVWRKSRVYVRIILSYDLSLSSDKRREKLLIWGSILYSWSWRPWWSNKLLFRNIVNDIYLCINLKNIWNEYVCIYRNTLFIKYQLIYKWEKYKITKYLVRIKYLFESYSESIYYKKTLLVVTLDPLNEEKKWMKLVGSLELS